MTVRFLVSEYIPSDFDPGVTTYGYGRIIYDVNTNALYYSGDPTQPPTEINGGGAGGNNQGGDGITSFTLGSTSISLGQTYSTLDGDLVWTGKQLFQGDAALPIGGSLYLAGPSDTNWRMGYGLQAINTTHVGSATSVQLVVGSGGDGPDGFALGTADGISLVEAIGLYQTLFFTAPGGVVFENSVTATALQTTQPAETSNVLWNYNGFVVLSNGSGTTPSLRIFSTDETQTNDVFLDRGPIYRKVIQFTNVPHDAMTLLDGTLTSSYIGAIVSVAGSFTDMGEDIITLPLPFVDATGAGSIAVFADGNGLELQLGVARDNANSGYVIIEYTKQ